MQTRNGYCENCTVKMKSSASSISELVSMPAFTKDESTAMLPTITRAPLQGKIEKQTEWATINGTVMLEQSYTHTHFHNIRPCYVIMLLLARTTAVQTEGENSICHCQYWAAASAERLHLILPEVSI